jgi:Muconolactone delta-isomerase
MKYLVVGSEGPGFTSTDEAVEVLENEILPGFDALLRLEKENKIVAGGLPVAEREVVFIVEAPSHEELDLLLRGLPMWGALKWKVTPLQTFESRAAYERRLVKQIKSKH